MQKIKKFCGWIFSLMSVLCLSMSVWVSRSRLLQHHGIPSLRLFVPGAVLFLFAYVFGMAWWCTWKGRPSARAWGIIASLVTMYIPLSLTYFFHSPFSNSIYKAIVFSFLALIAYLWPEKQADETLHAQEEDDITSHR